MMGMVLRKAGTALFIILKWALLATLAVFKLAFGLAKLFLLLFVLAVEAVSSISGVSSGRR